MPRELVAVAPRTPEIREYDDPPLGERQIRIRSEFASPKHGTELHGYRSPGGSGRSYDPYWGCVVERPETAGRSHFPMPLGNMAVGTVIAAGPAVSRFRPGDRVFGHFPIRETHTLDEAHADPLPAGLSPEAAVCLDPAVMALAMREATIRLGDSVAVFGLGAIGLMALQMARFSGASQVLAIVPIEGRRQVALALGADVALDPTAEDVALAVRRLAPPLELPLAQPPVASRVLGGYWDMPTQYGQRGVDVAVEVSGSIRGLQGAIRSTRYGGTICILSMYGGDASGLRLGDEFHINAQRIVMARVESLPLRDCPAWTLERLVRVALDWLVSGRLRADGIITPIVPFEEAADAYRMIDEHPERAIKLGITFICRT